MYKAEMTKEELLHKLSTTEAKLRHAQKLMKTQRMNYWKQFWGLQAKTVVALLMMLIIVTGAGAADRKFIDGNDWSKWPEVFKLTYIDGFLSGVVFWRGLVGENPKEAEVIWECIKDWPPSQNLAVVEKYLKDNPHQWDKAIFVLIDDALTDACRKKGTTR